jgi:SAM-dependent methyltransferase
MTATATPPAGAADFGADYAQEQLRRSRHPLRRPIKRLYLDRVLSQVHGPTIDFGCGAGQLLRRLPAGSVGIEINPHLIAALRKEGLDVRQAGGEASDFELGEFEPGRWRTLTISHVVEHLVEPERDLRALFSACTRLGIDRVVMTVPGAKGYASDPTHRTFIDADWVAREFARPYAGFAALPPSYFPGPWRSLGDHFVFHETRFVFTRA